MRNKISLVYWSSSRLYFMNELERLCIENNLEFDVFAFSHHPSWYTKDGRRYILNTVHLIKQILSVAISNRENNVVLFGTNLCRIFYPMLLLNKYRTFIYNEFPAMPSESMTLFWYDRLLFRSVKNVFVSSLERMKLCEYLFGVSRKIGVVNNLSISVINDQSSLTEEKEDKIIFAGLISSSRFNNSIVCKLNRMSVPMVIIGKMLDKKLLEGLSIPYEYYGDVSQTASLRMQKKYRYALLSYDQYTINNDYCAPIKIYEYIDAECVVVSVNKNQGLWRFFYEYPALFCWLDDFVTGSFRFDHHSYMEQRARFLSEAALENQAFIDKIINVDWK